MLLDLSVNLVALAVLAYGLYFRRHRRRDLFLALVALNISLFVVTSTLSTAALDVGVGFGLFAVLSLVRLRSETSTQEEIGYYFVTLVLGLLNGLRSIDAPTLIALNAIILAVMYVADHPHLLRGYQRQRITLDVVHRDDTHLTADLEHRLGAEVHHLVVCEVDHVREITVCDVRLRRPPAPRRGRRRDATTGAAVRRPVEVGT
ncbi:DUF4956 domain-containing protein [Nitriliruptoraceae bacterium ZYF776]|nr:DUF4956 domain-containing protein [Profundirhabdus halotolerans]